MRQIIYSRPEGIATDEHGGNRESIRRKEGMVEHTKSCEMHFYDCAHRVAKEAWSSQSRKKFITMIHAVFIRPKLLEAMKKSAVPCSNGLQINPR